MGVQGGARVRRVGLCVVAATSLLITTVAFQAVFQESARADHFENMYPMTPQQGGNQNCDGGVCRTDGRDFRWSYKYLTDPNMFWAVAFTLSETWDPDTVLNVTAYAEPVVACAPNTNCALTDNVYVQGDIPLGAGFGTTNCMKAIPNTPKCDMFFIKYDIQEICYYYCVGGGPYATFNHVDAFRHMACHETGHSVGLMHGENANPPVSQYIYWADLRCMKGMTVWEWELASWPHQPWAGWHNVNLVNATY